MANENRLIDANELKKKQTVLWDEALGFSDCVLIEDINNAPTVDAVEVVRCKDCKHYSPWESCDVWHTDPNPEDFCGSGEKEDHGSA